MEQPIKIEQNDEVKIEEEVMDEKEMKMCNWLVVNYLALRAGTLPKRCKKQLDEITTDWITHVEDNLLHMPRHLNMNYTKKSPKWPIYVIESYCKQMDQTNQGWWRDFKNMPN